MANSLGRDLTGCVVLVRADVLTPEFADPDRRKFHVEGGFGAVDFTAGTAVFGTWVADDERGRISGYDVEAVVEEPTPAFDTWVADEVPKAERESSLRPGGLPWAVDPDATAAWGCRTIVQQDGYVDFVPDRQSADGPPEKIDELFQLLEARFPTAELKGTIGDLLRLGPYAGGMDTRQDEFFVLYMDDNLVVIANTRGSAGYCYVNAWITAWE